MTFGAGGFICSFSDKELAEFHHFLEKGFPFSDPKKVKRGVTYAGKQREGVCVLNKHLFVDENGLEISKLAWPPIGGPSIELANKGQHSAIDLQCDINLPLESSAPLYNLLQVMQKIFKHNFIPSKNCICYTYNIIQPPTNHFFRSFCCFCWCNGSAL